MTVGRVDIFIPQHGKFFYLHKFKKSGLRYELCTCIKTGDIVWVNGPYPCGTHNDIMIFRDSLMSHLSENERVEADDRYIGECPGHIKCPAHLTNNPRSRYMQQRVRNRQETLNSCIKNFDILRAMYRHSLENHGDVVRAVLVIVQVAINNGEKLFDCKYRNMPYVYP